MTNETLKRISKASLKTGISTFVFGGEFGLLSLASLGIPQALQTGDIQSLSPFGGYETFRATVQGADISWHAAYQAYAPAAAYAIGAGEATVALLVAAGIAAGARMIRRRQSRQRQS